MDKKAAQELGFEPGGFRRHHHSGICHGHHFPHCGGIKGKGHCGITPVDKIFQFDHPPDPADERNPGVSPLITDTQDRAEEMFLEKGDIKTGDGITIPQEKITLGNLDSKVEFTLTASGMFQIVVNNFSDERRAGIYTLSVR